MALQVLLASAGIGGEDAQWAWKSHGLAPAMGEDGGVLSLVLCTSSPRKS